MKPWWVRATKNALLGILTAPVAYLALLAFVFLGAVVRGASLASAVDSFTDPVKLGRLGGFALLIGAIGLFLGVSSTPILKCPPSKSDKYRVLAVGAVANTLLPPYLGTLLSPTQGYFDCLGLGLFIGLPLTLALSTHFHNKALKEFLARQGGNKE